jgi:biofilm PGA synthesis N-glycosyltransferase PgaC
MYFLVRNKFLITLLIAVLWFALCTWLAFPWIRDLGQYVSIVLSFIIIFFIALLPGFMNVFLLVGYLIDKRPKDKQITHWPNISVLIPAFNERAAIAQTVEAIANQKYEGGIQIIVIDNASEDDTLKILQNLKVSNLVIATEATRGKSYALNKGLSLATYDYILTVDADTYLLPDAVKEIMTRFLSAPPNTAAVAGSVYVKNSRQSFMTRLQEWDYFHSIAAVKRMQSLFQGTLVAQGSFSVYKKTCIEEVGAWPATVGEDIVLTWGLLEKNYRIDFSEKAIAFTNVPTTYKAFFQQRSRWSRGMIEAFLAHPQVLIRPKLVTFLIYWDLLFPVVDACYFFIFIPSVIAAFFGYFFIVGPMTLAVLPIAFLINLNFFVGQRKMFSEHVLKIRKNKLGFVVYMIFYYLIMVPACIHGYLSEIFQLKKRWGKK